MIFNIGKTLEGDSKLIQTRIVCGKWVLETDEVYFACHYIDLERFKQALQSQKRINARDR